MNDTEYKHAMNEIKEEKVIALKTLKKNWNESDTGYQFTFDEYIALKEKIETNYKEIKNRFQRERAEAIQMKKSSFSQLNDTINALRLESTGGHYLHGLASGVGSMFGMLLSFLVFILYKKFKHGYDRVKYSSSDTPLEDSKYCYIDIINSNVKPAELQQELQQKEA